jgi:hypothetical protein
MPGLQSNFKLGNNAQIKLKLGISVISKLQIKEHMTKLPIHPKVEVAYRNNLWGNIGGQPWEQPWQTSVFYTINCAG